jgi:hypothetical protein
LHSKEEAGGRLHQGIILARRHEETFQAMVLIADRNSGGGSNRSRWSETALHVFEEPLGCLIDRVGIARIRCSQSNRERGKLLLRETEVTKTDLLRDGGTHFCVRLHLARCCCIRRVRDDDNSWRTCEQRREDQQNLKLANHTRRALNKLSGCRDRDRGRTDR